MSESPSVQDARHVSPMSQVSASPRQSPVRINRKSPTPSEHERYRRRSTSSRSRSPRRSTSRSRSVSRNRRGGSSRLSTSPPVQSREAYEAVQRIPTVKLNYELEYTLSGHAGPVSAVKFSPDGKWIASCSGDKSVKVWDATTGVHEHTFEGHLGGISMIAWSPDSHWLASASDDKLIRLWDVLLKKPYPYPFVGHSNYVYSLAFSPKGNILASGSHDEAVFVWDVRAVKSIRSLPAHSDPIGGVDFTYDGTLIASCSSDGLIRLWDTATGQCLRTIIHEDHAPVMNLQFSPNGKYILAWTLDSAVRLWNYVDGTCVKTYSGHVNKSFGICGCFGNYHKFDIAYDDTPSAMVVSGSEDGAIWMWDINSKEVLQKIEGAHDGVIFGTHVSPDSKAIVSGGQDGLIKIWKLKEAPVLQQQEGSGMPTPIGAMPYSGAQTPMERMDIDEDATIKKEDT